MCDFPARKPEHICNPPLDMGPMAAYWEKENVCNYSGDGGLMVMERIK